MPIDNVVTNAVGALKPFVSVANKNLELDRSPTIYDQAEIGTIVTNPNTQLSYILQAIVDGKFIWNEITTTTITPVTPFQSGFSAFLSNDMPNVTGDGTFVDVICDAVVVDLNGDYDNTTGLFTAPVTGLYLFTYDNTTYNSSNDPGVTLWVASIQLTKSSDNYVSSQLAFTQDQVAAYSSNSSILYLLAGDTVGLQISAFFPFYPQVIGIKGFSAPNFGVTFAGKLLN